EETALLDACEKYGGDLPHVVLLALETAMRRGEIAGMTWDDVDLKKRTVTLPETKTGEVRIVSLSSEAIRILSKSAVRPRTSVRGYKA
ncbi:MAG: tyrosine-type recombinase/integrase, partial [Nitrospiraceae bacterium]|nr:tyrosine-type recombinase/integrase [Nitrospiraceae bacterium]